MTGKEIIEYIENNRLEDYTFVVCHEQGESAYDVMELCIDEIHREVEVI